MPVKGFRVKTLKDFLSLADQVTSPKFVDTKNSLAFFYVKKRIEYEPATKEETEAIIKRGFIEGEEREVLDFF